MFKTNSEVLEKTEGYYLLLRAQYPIDNSHKSLPL